MSEAVTDIIMSRSRQADGLRTMMIWSMAAHAVVIAALALAPARTVDEAPPPVMMISLGGSPGPKTDGITQMGARAVQAKAETAPRLTTPPAAEQPKMTLPDPRTRRQTERPRPTQAPTESNARTLSTGAETREGSARVETQVPRGLGFGLATGGGTGGDIKVDAPNFCCEEYLIRMRDIIHGNWTPKQGLIGMVQVKFTIRRTGAVVDVQIERPSGQAPLDQESLRTLLRTPQLPPLPERYDNPTLTVHMIFEYQR